MTRSQWRREVIARQGFYCAARDDSDCDGRLETHHVIYRSQGGKDDPENGMMFCTRHHALVHQRRLPIHRTWLLSDQITYFEERGHVSWDADGIPKGTGWKGFATLSSR